MKRIKKPAFLVPAICLALSTLVFINFSAPATMAQEGKKPGIAPVNPEFQRYIDLKKRGRLQTATSENHALGLIPSPFQPGNTPMY